MFPIFIAGAQSPFVGELDATEYGKDLEKRGNLFHVHMSSLEARGTSSRASFYLARFAGSESNQ